MSLVALGTPLLPPERPAAASAPVYAALCLGAASMEAGSTCTQADDGPTYPRVEQAPADRSPSHRYRCQTRYDFTDRFTCEFGEPKATRNVALVGNSHAVHWLPALHEIGLRRGFKITTFLSAVCVATTTRVSMATPRQTENCHAWGEWARETTATGEYDLIVQSERAFRPPLRPATATASTNAGSTST